jgi:glycosyltransferase involved in cell wall biosynthesis
MDTPPKVSCLCLTKARRQWLPIAVECYRRQTHSPRELIIVADTEDDIIGLDLADARVLFSGPATIGFKRNLGTRAATGEIIAVWDDDDFSAPGRLAHQAARLVETEKAVTGYHEMDFTDGANWWHYRNGPPGYVFDTSLMFRRDWWLLHPFTNEQLCCEDAFKAEALRTGQLDVDGFDGRMHCTIHPSNTWPRRVTHSTNWLQIEKPNLRQD